VEDSSILGAGKGVAMITSDLSEVSNFTADIGMRMDRTLDDTLRLYADLCREFRDALRQWGRDVFGGRVEFKPEVEQVWLADGRRIYSRAKDVYDSSLKSAGPRDTLENLTALETALVDLDRLLTGWVTPRLSVGPSARRRLLPDQAATEEELQRIASLTGER
jgi:hypothetical protein